MHQIQLYKRIPSKETSKVLILSHPDSNNHIDNINQLCRFLHDNTFSVHGVFLDSNVLVNWRDFAEKAGHFKNIIFISSPKLCELCILYKNRKNLNTKKKQRWQALLVDRYGEYVPCVVLDQLRCAYQSPNSNFKFHVVTFGLKEALFTKLFLKQHETFLNSENSQSYCLSVDVFNSALTSRQTSGEYKSNNSVFKLINTMLET